MKQEGDLKILIIQTVGIENHNNDSKLYLMYEHIRQVVVIMRYRYENAFDV